MKTMSYSQSRANYARLLDSVTDDQEEVIITRPGKEPVVMISLDEYESLTETAYLLGDRANAEHLRRAVAALDAGTGEPHELLE